MPRGGKRTGAIGQAYSNRSDLNGPQPIGNFAKSGPYGTGVALSDAQKALPVANAPQATPQLQQPGGAPPQGPPPDQPPGPPPGAFGPLNRPTDRPSEPLTHGLPTGPGAGPEVMTPPPTSTAQTLLGQVANSPYASDELRSLWKMMQR